MSKNITIQEGNTAKQMIVNKLKTDTVGGGSCTWVPEDEVSLGTKSITTNGVYKASDDGKYGYSQVTVNVAGAAGSANSDGTPTTNPSIGSGTGGGTGGSGTDPGTVDPGTGGGTDDPGTGGGSTWIAPGGPGSGVVGTDPEDGNEYFIGIDENGTITKTKIPSGIEIGKEPNKTDYIEDETIDYSGIIVTLKGGDSAIFANTRYPNGRVPMQELTFPETTAKISSENEEIWSNGSGFNCTLISFSKRPIGNWTQGYYYDPSPCGSTTVNDSEGNSVSTETYLRAQNISNIYATRTIDDEGNNILLVSQPSTTYGLVALWPETQTHFGAPGISNYTIPYKGNMYMIYISDEMSVANIPFSTNIGSGDTSELVRQESTQSIPVKWVSPYDGRTFEDSFNITVTSSTSGTTGGDTSGGSGYSDDSGGSSSGGGTSFDSGSGYSDDSGGSSSGGGTSF